MSYCIFLDDERFPAQVNWCKFPEIMYDRYNYPLVICRSLKEFQDTILSKGFPCAISFDHDLGKRQPTGYDAVNWMIDLDIQDDITLPADFTFSVHSMNPVGAENIQKKLDNYLKFKKGR